MKAISRNIQKETIMINVSQKIDELVAKTNVFLLLKNAMKITYKAIDKMILNIEKID